MPRKFTIFLFYVFIVVSTVLGTILNSNNKAWAVCINNGFDDLFVRDHQVVYCKDYIPNTGFINLYKLEPNLDTPLL